MVLVEETDRLTSEYDAVHSHMCLLGTTLYKLSTLVDRPAMNLTGAMFVASNNDKFATIGDA